jgi:hypothetical protein
MSIYGRLSIRCDTECCWCKGVKEDGAPNRFEFRLGECFGSSVGNSPADQILGGAQSTTNVENNTNLEGSPDPKTMTTPPSVEQALYYLMQAIFTDTAVEGSYCESDVEPNTAVPAPLNYLQIYFNDFQYAESNGPTSEDAPRLVET